MCALRLVLLGGFRAECDGVPVNAFDSDKARALLAYLAVEGHRSHRRDELIGLFWPEMPQRRALHNLSQTFYSLRSAFPRNPEGSLFEVTPQEIRIRGDACWADSVEMVTLLQNCEAHHHDPDSLCRACRDRLEQAVALYHGDFLAGLYLKDCAGFDEWQTARRESLKASLIRALGWLSRSLERSGTLEQALDYARRHTEIDGLDESAHRQVMRLLARTGRRAEALAQYSLCRESILAEVGVEPDAGTTALYQQILREPAWPVGLPGVHDLPLQLTPLIGRQAEVESIQRLLSGDGCCLVTIVGGGGSGKTHLALEAARQLVPVFCDGVYLVELDRSRPQQRLAPLIARALGLSSPHEANTFTAREAGPVLEERLNGFLVGRHMLLVLDGFESMLHECRWLSNLLRHASGLSVLATSRVRLSLEAEHVVMLDGLPYPSHPTRAEEMSTFGAVRLFAAAARRARPSFELDSSNGDSVAAVCQAVQGMPLGIILAAAWAEMLEPAQIAARITGQLAGLARPSLDLLTTDWADLPERQRSVRATFEYSLALLSEPAKEAFLRLSVFRGAFSPERALQVAGVDLRTLKQLVDHSMLQPVTGGWFRIHVLLRQYAEEQLATQATIAIATHEQHCHVILTALAARGSRIRSESLFGELAEIDREYPDVLDAWDWAAEHGRLDLVEAALWALWRYGEARNLLREDAVLLERTMDRLEQQGLSPKTVSLWARLGILRARFLIRLLDTQGAQRLLDRVEALLREQPSDAAGLRRDLAYLEIARGHLAQSGRPDWAAALSAYERALNLIYSTEDPWDIGYALLAVCRGHQGAGNLQASVHDAELGLETQRPSGDPALIAQLLQMQGVGLMLSGQSEAASLAADEYATYVERYRDPLHDSMLAAQRGFALLHAGRYREARPWFERAGQLADMPDELERHYSYLWLADLACLGSGDHDAVRFRPNQHNEDSAGLVRTGVIASAHLTWGILDLLQGDWEQAEQDLLAYIDHFRELARLDNITGPLALLALTARRRGNAELSCVRLLEALNTGLGQEYFLAVLITIGVCAVFAAEDGDLEEAVELYATATSHPAAADARWFQDILGAPVTHLTETLPAEVRHAAEARGREREPFATAREILARLAPSSEPQDTTAASPSP